MIQPLQNVRLTRVRSLASGHVSSEWWVRLMMHTSVGNALAVLSVAHLGAWQRVRPPVLAISDAVVADQLNTVPVFGLLLTENGKLYGSEEGETMVYTSLEDASRVLAQLKSTFPDTDLELLPLPLGHVLTQSGHLARVDGSESAAVPTEIVESTLPMVLVASPEARRAARRLREDSATPRPKPLAGAAAQLQAVPVFHIGSVEDPREKKETFWPFFFRTADVDALWEQLGEGAPRPEVTPTDLAALVDGLREADDAPAEPLICAPLDALEYVRERDRSAVSARAEADVEAAAEVAQLEEAESELL